VDSGAPAGPLRGSAYVVSAAWPAARAAGRLLAALGAPVSSRAGVPALTRAGTVISATPAGAAQDWAASGAMWLTGRADGPALHATGSPAALARGAALAVELLSASRGRRVCVEGAALLGERAALLGAARAGAVSVGGSSRIMRAADGPFALTLSRPEDVELVAALVSEEGASSQPWQAVAAWAAPRPLATVAERMELLGLPFGVPAFMPAPGAPLSPWRLRSIGPAPVRRPGLLVVNAGSLWAAPLCAHLLALAGASVVDVESPRRPDGARLGTPAFYELLHAGHSRVELDVASGRGRAQLHDLARQADVVLTGSRIFALERMGLMPGKLTGPRVWARITAHGPGSRRVGFGDDAAVAGGLVARDGPDIVLAGDAIADPLTGVVTAAAVLAYLESDCAWTVDVALGSVAACAVRLGATRGAVAAQAPHVARRTVRPG
jgi:crotonobetainyl-CoA:carnitine CoA-transferase CaiB-like acyl-CoA transferase